jgi:hypothetical protein
MRLDVGPASLQDSQCLEKIKAHLTHLMLPVALQNGNAMTFDAYCEWRYTRDLQVQGQAGFTAKREQY